MKSIFKGKVEEITYYFGTGNEQYHIWNYYSSENRIRSKSKIVEYKTFLEIDLSDPPLQKDDRFYNLDTDETYYIEDAMRGTRDSMVYLTDKVLETIVDEESKQKAEVDKQKYEEEKFKKLLEEEEEQKEEVQRDVRLEYKKSWWKRLFNLEM